MDLQKNTSKLKESAMKWIGKLRRVVNREKKSRKVVRER